MIIKKELKELKAVSTILFICLGLFVLVFFVDLCDGSAPNPDENFKYYWRTHWDAQLVTSFSIVLVAYSCQQNMFPLQSSLKDKSEIEKAVGLGLIYVLVVYVTLGIISVFLFGSTIDESVLDNISAEVTPSSYIIRISFLLVLACHIPYIFFSGKESICIMVDELMRGSMTDSLETMLQRAVIIDTKERDKDGDSEKTQLMAYKSMDKRFYYGITICLYLVEIVLSVFIPSIGVVFDFVTAFAVSSLAFIFPGLFYYLNEK